MTTRCDIIIAVWNQLEFTKNCIESIERNTGDVEYRLILIDNASDKPAMEYLSALAQAKKDRVLLIRNEVNLGFLKAANQGMKASDAPYVCLLNNDTLVTEGWLKEMIEIAAGSKDIGIVNPSSNNLGQKPLAGEPLEIYAAKIRKEAGNSIDLGAAIGFCMLIKREVLDKTGLFDEVYGRGNFEDTDLSRKAVKAGYRCVRACGSYVYHRENTSFNKINTFNADFERNREIFEFRWGKPKRIAYILDSCDGPSLIKIKQETVELARNGNWAWYFFKGAEDLPKHSNIMRVKVSGRNFYPEVFWRIIKKKKKFDEIHIGEPKYGRVLEMLSFWHKAKVKYY